MQLADRTRAKERPAPRDAPVEPGGEPETAAERLAAARRRELDALAALKARLRESEKRYVEALRRFDAHDAALAARRAVIDRLGLGGGRERT